MYRHYKSSSAPEEQISPQLYQQSQSQFLARQARAELANYTYGPEASNMNKGAKPTRLNALPASIARDAQARLYDINDGLHPSHSPLRRNNGVYGSPKSKGFGPRARKPRRSSTKQETHAAIGGAILVAAMSPVPVGAKAGPKARRRSQNAKHGPRPRRGSHRGDNNNAKHGPRPRRGSHRGDNNKLLYKRSHLDHVIEHSVKPAPRARGGSNKWRPLQRRSQSELVIGSKGTLSPVRKVAPAGPGSKSTAINTGLKGIMTDRQTKQFTNMAMKAAKEGDAGAIMNLVNLGFPIDISDQLGYTMLMHATWNGHADIAKFLCEYGCDVNITNARMDTALHFAYERGHSDIVSLLLSHGAEKSSKVKNEKGNIPKDLSNCVMDSLAKYLLEHAEGLDTSTAELTPDTDAAAATIQSPSPATSATDEAPDSVDLCKQSSIELATDTGRLKDMYNNRAMISFEVYSYADIFNAVDTDESGFVSKSRELPVALHIYGLTIRESTLATFPEMMDFDTFCSALNYAQDHQRGRGNSVTELAAEASEIFLGGACNPTRWRKEIAIPLLDKAGVTYYDPQVDEWHPGLLEPERVAKATCHIVLIVISKHTRGVASLVEAAELIANGRRVVLVIEDVSVGSRINGDELSVTECKDLNRGRAYLADVAHSYQCHVFSSIESAVQRCITMVQEHRQKMMEPAEDTRVRGLGKSELQQLLRSTFEKADTDGSKHLDPSEFAQALIDTQLNLSQKEVDHVLSMVDANHDGRISYDEFISIAFRVLGNIA